jgi:transposase
MSGQVYFSESFKIQIVREIESGKATQRELALRYGIKGNSTVLKWLRKYGSLPLPTPKKSGEKMMNSNNEELLMCENEIKELKKELEFSRMRNVVLETMIDVADRDLGLNLRKKCGAKPSTK